MRLPIGSWTLFIIMTMGLILMLVAERPELQGEEGRTGPAHVVRIVGHTVTWGAAAALTVRMIRSIRRAEAKEDEKRDEQQKPQPRKLSQARKV